MLNRRSFLALTGAAFAGVASRTLLAQAAKPKSPFVQQSLDAAAKAQLTGKMLRGDVGVVMGAGGNIGVVKSPVGGLVIDSGYSTSAEHLWEQLNAMGIDKVPLLINTHWHFDHTDGNAALHQHGAHILAHKRTRYWMMQAHVINIPVAFENVAFDAAPAAGLPNEVMTDRRSLHHGAETIEITHYPAAHTDSDMALVFKQANVVHTGDLFFNGFYPLIDSTSGGRLAGMVDGGRKILAASDAETIFIPGHGPIATRDEYQAFVTMLDTIGGNVAKLKSAGKSADEVAAAKPTEAFDEKWGKGFLDGEKFSHIVYAAV
jgi:glyoxylase-like metal-dependent hydrolase (beta-lactamase superfamily II)